MWNKESKFNQKEKDLVQETLGLYFLYKNEIYPKKKYILSNTYEFKQKNKYIVKNKFKLFNELFDIKSTYIDLCNVNKEERKYLNDLFNIVKKNHKFYYDDCCFLYSSFFESRKIEKEFELVKIINSLYDIEEIENLKAIKVFLQNKNDEDKNEILKYFLDWISANSQVILEEYEKYIKTNRVNDFIINMGIKQPIWFNDVYLKENVLLTGMKKKGSSSYISSIIKGDEKKVVFANSLAVFSKNPVDFFKELFLEIDKNFTEKFYDYKTKTKLLNQVFISLENEQIRNELSNKKEKVLEKKYKI